MGIQKMRARQDKRRRALQREIDSATWPSFAARLAATVGLVVVGVSGMVVGSTSSMSLLLVAVIPGAMTIAQYRRLRQRGAPTKKKRRKGR